MYILSSLVPSKMEKPPPPSCHKKGSRPRNLQGHVEKTGLCRFLVISSNFSIGEELEAFHCQS